MPRCIGWTSEGYLCKNDSSNGQYDRCRIHAKVLERKGMNVTLIDEVNSLAIRRRADFSDAIGRLLGDEEVIRDYDIKIRNSRIVQARLIADIELFYPVGCPLDNGKVEIGPIPMLGQRAERNTMLEYHQPERRPETQLQKIATDNQGVHRREVVDHIKENLEIIKKIPVPQEYTWNKKICSRTPGDIIEKCSIPPDAVSQMIHLYCSDANIYDLGQGIYGKTLDKVWQYILNSEHKPDLINILRSTLLENVATCAQGNLTRLLTVLVGYLDNLGQGETLNETLGREIGQIALDKLGDKYTRVVKVLEANKVPKEERNIWLSDFITEMI